MHVCAFFSAAIFSITSKSSCHHQDDLRTHQIVLLKTNVISAERLKDTHLRREAGEKGASRLLPQESKANLVKDMRFAGTELPIVKYGTSKRQHHLD